MLSPCYTMNVAARGSQACLTPKLLFSPPFVLLSILGDIHTEKSINMYS